MKALMPVDELVVAAADIILQLVDHKQYSHLKAVDLHEKVLNDTRGLVS